MKNRIGLYEKALPNVMSWSDKFRAAKTAGYDFIEISIDESDARLSRLNYSTQAIRELNELQAEYDLPLLSMCLSGHRRFPFGSRDEKTQKKAYEIMEKALKLAQKIHLRNIQLAGYDVYYEDRDEHTEKAFLEGLKWAAKRAEYYGIMLSLEVMDTPFMGTIARAAKYVDLIQSPYLKIYPDVGNLTQFSDDPWSELKTYHHHFVGIHLKDTLPNQFKCVEFGEGNVHFEMVFETLKTIDYTGPLLIEMWADNTQSESFENTVSRIKKAKSWLQKRM